MGDKQRAQAQAEGNKYTQSLPFESRKLQKKKKRPTKIIEEKRILKRQREEDFFFGMNRRICSSFDYSSDEFLIKPLIN